eukprot:9490431-Pyramimonas_sp.AAC.1
MGVHAPGQCCVTVPDAVGGVPFPNCASLRNDPRKGRHRALATRAREEPIWARFVSTGTHKLEFFA